MENRCKIDNDDKETSKIPVPIPVLRNFKTVIIHVLVGIDKECPTAYRII